MLLIDDSLEKLAKGGPVALMARALMERALEPDSINRLFEDNAERQYSKRLMFSSMVDVMTAVVCGKHPSVRDFGQVRVRAQIT